jgi:hypothetical protein
MRKLFSLLVLTAVTALACQALTVNITPGKLAQVIDDDVEITELVISGSMDARDFLFITENLNHLNVLDLSQVTIVPYNKSVPVYGTYIDYLGNEIPRTAFFGKPLTSVILPAGIEGIGYAAFAGCDQLQSIELPASVTYLEDYAFAGSGLTSIELPSTVYWMGDGVFSRCNALTQANVNSTEVGRFAFLGDTALNALTIGNNVRAIKEGAFNGCTALTTIRFAAKSQLSRIGDEAFINSGLRDINIKNIAVNSIGDWALSQTRLMSIALTDGLTHLGDGALAHNPYLTHAELPDMGKVNTTSSKWDTNSTGSPVADNTGVISPKRASARIKPTLEVIGAYAFADDSLLNVSHLLKNGVQTIEPYAFYNNSLEMDTVFLPSSIVFLGDSAMAGMTGMRVLHTAAEDVPELGVGVWAGVDQPSIPLITPNDEATAMYREADQWMNFFFAPDFILGDVNDDGFVNIADVTTLIDYILDPTTPVNLLASDVDQDGQIGISDVTAIIDMILGNSNHMSLMDIKNEIERLFVKTSDALTVESTTVNADMTRTIDIALNNDENSYHAMQCELVLPRGMQLTAVEPMDRGKDHTSYTIKHEVEENVYTLMNVSMNNQLYAGNEGKVLRLTLTVTDEFDAASAEMQLTNVMFVDTNNRIHHAADVMSKFNENTAVEKVIADKQIEKVTYVNIAGQQSEKPFDGMNIVVTTYTDGTTSTTKVIK